MRKNHSKIVCIKLVHLPYLFCKLFNVEFGENSSSSLEFSYRTKGPRERQREGGGRSKCMRFLLNFISQNRLNETIN